MCDRWAVVTPLYAMDELVSYCKGFADLETSCKFDNTYCEVSSKRHVLQAEGGMLFNFFKSSDH